MDRLDQRLYDYLKHNNPGAGVVVFIRRAAWTGGVISIEMIAGLPCALCASVAEWPADRLLQLALDRDV